MQLLTVAHPDDPALEMALTATALQAVARRQAPELIRVYRPGPTVAFGRQDRRLPGFMDACSAARAHGRVPVVRLGGGHAAAYDRDCIVVELIRSHEHLIGGLEARFVDLVKLLEHVLANAGVPVRRGELPGEYCAGRFSLHLVDGPKVAGVAQRVVVGASLTTAVLVVGGGEWLRATIADVYAALELPVDIATAGAVADRHPGVVASSLLGECVDLAAERYRADPAEPRAELADRARELIPTIRA